jgi:DNA anti-recombination protein RmuC
LIELFLSSPEYISTFGAVLAIMGSVVLAFAMSKVFWELGFGIKAISTSIQSMNSGRDVIVFDGLSRRIDRAQKYSKLPTFIGILLICLSLPFQAYSLHLSSNQAQKKEKAKLQKEYTLKSELDALQLKIESIQQNSKESHESRESELEEFKKQQSKLFKDLTERVNSFAHNKALKGDS